MAQEKAFPLAGHHLNDPGATYNGRKESEEMMCIRDLIVKELQAKGNSFEVDKDSETNTVLQSRIKPNRTDVVVDNHLNASANPKASGCEVFVSDNAGANSKAMAKEMVDGISSILGIANRGVKAESQSPRKKIGILNKPGIAVLVEYCFISNPDDMKKWDEKKPLVTKFVAGVIVKYDNLIN